MRTLHKAGLILTAFAFCWTGAAAFPIKELDKPDPAVVLPQATLQAEPNALNASRIPLLLNALLTDIEPLTASQLLPTNRAEEMDGHLPEPKPLLLFATGFLGLAIGIHIKRMM